MSRRGTLFVISGPAGAGKSEIVKKLMKEHPELRLSVSCTTREARPGEIDGVHYHFVSDERFDELIAENAFYEWAHVHQNRYGTLKSVVSAELDQGSDLILEIDVQGCMNVLKQAQDAVSIFVSPPSCENLEKRLRDRGTETAESLRVRLGNVEKEVAQAYNYQYVIVHQDWNDVPDALSIAANEVYSIITAKRCELSAQKGFLDDLSAQLRDEQKI